MAAELEAAYLDTATVDSLCELVRQGDLALLQKLWETRGAEMHPLNANALDRVLRPMGLAGRDLCWSEWIRRRQQDVLKDLEWAENRWKQGKSRPGDRLRARWMMWTLTSTVRQLRDQTTRALYWFGRSDPAALFELTIDSLAVNDAYVGERMIAAAYGVVMSHQSADTDFGVHLNPFLKQLATCLVGDSATAPTTHYLARTYVRGILSFAAKFYEGQIPDTLRGNWSFAAPQPVAPIDKADARAEEVGRTIHMDFGNYTLGRLFEGRSNYDMSHPGHQAAEAHVLGVVWSVGWRQAIFETIDRRIDEDAYRPGTPLRVERYGKKYGWIGFFTYAGMLEAQGLLPEHGARLSDVDIDPSFPDQPLQDGVATGPQTWLKPEVQSHERWILGATDLPRQLIARPKIGRHKGPWVAVHGVVEAADKVLGRRAWAVVSALIVPAQGSTQVVAALNAGERPWIAGEVPGDYYTFAGEIPWHPTFAAELLAERGFESAYREKIRIATGDVEIEAVAHRYAWESYHSKVNQGGGVSVPSHRFSTRFDLRSVPQGFDQVLPDGTKATISLRGVDGLEGDILYVREDLLRRYTGDRTIAWFAFGERQLYPYPSSPPRWLADAQRKQANAWRMVLTEADLGPEGAKKTTKKTQRRVKKGAETRRWKAHPTKKGGPGPATKKQRLDRRRA